MTHPISHSDWYSVDDSVLEPSHRRALLHVPDKYRKDVASPLIIAMHGKEQSPAEFEQHTQLSNPEVNSEAIVVYPEGIKLQWTGDPESPAREEIDDIKFINTLIDHLQQDYNINNHRIYALGFSNGGGLTDLLASDDHASSRIAAFAISSGAFYTDSALKEPLFSHCNPGRTPIALMEFHGDSDPVIHYDGKSTPDGVTFSLPDFFDIWVHRNKISTPCQQTDLYEGKVTRYAWSVGDKEVLVHYLVRGFGHGWPTTRPLNNDEQRRGPAVFDATPIVLDWFKQFGLP